MSERTHRPSFRHHPKHGETARVIDEKRLSREMNGPTFDADGYPTDETLDRIKGWPIETNADFAAVMDFAGAAWSYPDYWECDPSWVAGEYADQKPQRRYVFSTGGWSGNESIVSAIEENQMVQLIGAWSWRRGGHYEYRFPVEPG